MNQNAAIVLIVAAVAFAIGRSSVAVDSCTAPTVQDFRAVAEPESLFVSSATPSVVIVADSSSEYAQRWLIDEAEQLRSRGWVVRSLDLEGLDEVRFYVRANGKWKTHYGQMGMASLREIVGQ